MSVRQTPISHLSFHGTALADLIRSRARPAWIIRRRYAPFGPFLAFRRRRKRGPQKSQHHAAAGRKQANSARRPSCRRDRVPEHAHMSTFARLPEKLSTHHLL